MLAASVWRPLYLTLHPLASTPPADANATRREDPGARRPRSDANATICAVFEPRRLRAVADVTICAILKAPGPLGRVLRAPPRMRILGFCRERPHAAPSPPVRISQIVTSASRGRPRSPRTAQIVTSAAGHPAGRVAGLGQPAGGLRGPPQRRSGCGTPLLGQREIRCCGGSHPGGASTG